MDFRTQIPIPKYNYPIDYNSRLVSFGSCFAENMGEKLAYFKFVNAVNPFGIIFNPVSIEKIIDRVVNQKPFTEKDIFYHNELWHCYDVHSEWSNPDKKEFLDSLNNLLESTNNQISESTHIIITYGTSWVYRNKETQQIVANCHKVSQNQFDKEILSVETIEKAIQNTIDLVQQLNPDCHFIFTVSPVRHIKDGFPENQRSKAHLITAIHNSQLATRNSNYFPSYEIMMDELRDYRFYADDMLHPSQSAINYIWERFSEQYISSDCFSIMQEVCNIQKGLAHRPFNSNGESHQNFIKDLKIKMSNLTAKFPQIQF